MYTDVSFLLNLRLTYKFWKKHSGSQGFCNCFKLKAPNLHNFQITDFLDVSKNQNYLKIYSEPVWNNVKGQNETPL